MVGRARGAEAGLEPGLASSTILLTGATGFLGKAVAATLLRLDAFERLLIVVRAADEESAKRRLEQEVLRSEALEALPADSIERLLAGGRVRAIALDLDREEKLPADPELAKIQTVIHCAASVSFEDPLDEILAVNALGPARLLDGLRAAGADPHFVHVSTAYAADCSRERVGEEGAPHPGLADLDPAAMLAAARRWREEAEAASRRDSQLRGFEREAARDVVHRPELDRAAVREERRAAWVRQQLSGSGRRFAASSGWPDTYALTKALGERLLRERGGRITIVRPTIIESALQRPRPGWLEGIKVADPLILAYAARGLTHLPGRASNPIDIVPVDCVANACVAAAAYPPPEGTRTIAVGSSARNPLVLGELAAQIRAHFREQPLRKRDGTAIEIGELRFVDGRLAVRKAMRREAAIGMAAKLAAQGPRATERKLRRNGNLASQVTRMVKIYGPYTELRCTFDDACARSLAGLMRVDDRAALPFDASGLDWEAYLRGIHLPEVQRMAERRGG